MAEENIKDVLLSTSRLASYNMVLQLSFRVLTFILNAFTLRYISKYALGVVNVRLVLLYSTVLFMSREGFRRACLSKSPKKDGNSHYVSEWRKMMNILWCIFPIGILLTSIFTYLWIYHLERPDPDLISFYSTAVIIFGVSVMIELFAEPLFIMAQALMFVKLRVLSEGIPMVLKCVSTVILVVFFPKLGILAFCISQLIFSITYVFFMYGYFTWYIKSGNAKKFNDFPFSTVSQFFPTFSQSTVTITDDTSSLIWSFFKQSVLKQILTEGEKFVMTFFNVLAFGDQGVYDVVNNLGSLAARFIFLPIEESFYIFFAKMLERGVAVEKQNEERLKLVTHVLFSLLRLVFLIGLVIFVFGFSYSYLFLHLYGGSMLSEGTGPSLLRAYSFYVLLIAINGTTECFVFAAMNQKEVDGYNNKMLIFSLVFLTSSYYFTLHLGSIGFILANCLNMAVRILHSIYFIHRYFLGRKEDTPLQGLTLHWAVIHTFVAVFVCCWLSEAFFRDYAIMHFFIGHVTSGILCLAVLLGILHASQGPLVQFLKEQFYSRKKND